MTTLAEVNRYLVVIPVIFKPESMISQPKSLRMLWISAKNMPRRDKRE